MKKMILYEEDKIKKYTEPYANEVVKFGEMGVIPIVYIMKQEGKTL